MLDPLLAGRYPEALWRVWPGCELLVLADDMSVIARPIDYLGLNYYSRAVIRAEAGGMGFGYERRFGLVHVEFATQQRTPKDSALAYAAFLRGRAA